MELQSDNLLRHTKIKRIRFSLWPTSMLRKPLYTKHREHIRNNARRIKL